MKKSLWITIVAASVLAATHNPISCMESEGYSSEQYSEEQPNKKRAKSKLSADEQDKINASLIEAIVNNDIQKAVSCLEIGAAIGGNYIDSEDTGMKNYLTPETIQKITNNDIQDIANAFDPLALAVKFGFIDMIKAVINYVPENDDESYYILGEALLAAFLDNKLEIMQFLINHKASPDYCRNDETPLLCFVEATTSTQALSLLLEHGADINAFDQNGCTSLRYAAECGNTAAVKLLLERKASLRVEDEENKYDQFDHSPLQGALTNNHPDTALCILKHFMPSHDLYSADAYKKLKVLLLGFYKKDESNLSKLPKELFYTIISYTPELIFNKKLLAQIISRNRYNTPLVSNCNDDFQDVQPLLESMARLKLDEQGKTVLKQFKSSSILVNDQNENESEEYDTSKITDLEQKNLLDALLNPNTPDNDECYQTLFAMNLWDDLQKKNAPAASKDDNPSNENISSPIDQTHNSGKQEE